MKLHAYYVYVLECSDGSYYAGMTNRIGERIVKHKLGKASKYTRSRLPVKLKWAFEVSGKGPALSFEYKIKSLSRREKEVLVTTRWLDDTEVSRLSPIRGSGDLVQLNDANWYFKRDDIVVNEETKEESTKMRFFGPFPTREITEVAYKEYILVKDS